MTGKTNSIRARNLKFAVPLSPSPSTRPEQVRCCLLGVALNGVKFDPGTAEFWNHNRGSGWNKEAIVNGIGRVGLGSSIAPHNPMAAIITTASPSVLSNNLMETTT